MIFSGRFAGKAAVVTGALPRIGRAVALRLSIAALSGGLPKMRSGLVRRLVYARDDPGKERIRKWLIDLDDAQLQSGLGLTAEDIAVLRTGTRKAWRAGVNPAQRRIGDARTSRYAETDARWQRDPEGIDDALRAKGVSA